MRQFVAVVGVCLLVVGCGEGDVVDDGDGLERGAPVHQFDIFLNGFHYVSGERGVQVEANHYCSSTLGDEFIQCVLYDGIDASARLIGVEYVISRELFSTLPAEEKALWHSHSYEVRSGALIAPGRPAEDEHDLMEDLVTTYGKTWHLWQPEVALPVGAATLMKAFTADGQLDEELLADRDQRFGVDSAALREERKDIADPGFDESVLEEPQLDVCDEEPLPEE
jgi:hypothetical protein